MSKQAKKPLILVDGSSYLYRAYHAMPALSNADGEQTGTIYGVLNMLRKLLQEYKPEQMVVVFDAKGKTFRDDMYPEYKANRPPMPDDLRQQVEPILEIVQAMGLPMLQIGGVEADDVIGTLAQQATANKQDVIISTGDKDMAQLVNEYVSLINTMNNSTMDEAGVKEKFGVTPAQIIDYLALIGDTSDNVPGVNKVGPKTAAKWLDKYETVEALVADADNIKGKIGEHLRNGLEQLPLSQKLVTIKCDVELNQDADSLKIKPADRDALISWYKRFEFKTWHSELLSEHLGDASDSEGSSVASEKTDVEYETILTQSAMDKWIKQLKKLTCSHLIQRQPALIICRQKSLGYLFLLCQVRRRMYLWHTIILVRRNNYRASMFCNNSSHCWKTTRQKLLVSILSMI